MKLIKLFWYGDRYPFLNIFLWPLSILFYLIVVLRAWLYQTQFLSSVKFSVPVIVVGNLTVGGTGKTPLVIWLANFLAQHGMRPGVVSRGVGGAKQFTPMWATLDTDVRAVGDEAILLAKRAGCPVVVCIDRPRAVAELLANRSCNVIIADDGLQHYRLARDIEIALIDSERGFGKGHLLPAGPLREPLSRLRKVDFVIYQGKPTPAQITMQLKGKFLVSIVDETQTKALSKCKQLKCHAVAGIGNPSRFFTTLQEAGLDIIEHIFPDHYHFQAKDFNFADELPILMTEKDAVKCKLLADHRFWYLAVFVQVDEHFPQQLLEKVKYYQGKKHV